MKRFHEIFGLNHRVQFLSMRQVENTYNTPTNRLINVEAVGNITPIKTLNRMPVVLCPSSVDKKREDNLYYNQIHNTKKVL